MRKLLFSLVVATALVSCKKETTVSNNNVSDVDSTLVVEESFETAEPISLKEMSSDKVSELIQTQNDTLYVTNFFATWCGPCIRELPHFREQMAKRSGEKIKFSFVNLDETDLWDNKVKEFSADHGISERVILTDPQLLDESFFSKNFNTWDGSSIPFTIMQKGNKRDEHIGYMNSQLMEEKINSFQ